MGDVENQVVLVTGSSGFVGQHVVKLLQEKDQQVREIRCIDLKPYQNNLGHETNHPMKVVTGDIRNEKTVLDIMAGVDIVIHCAALVDTNMYQDDEGLKQTNVNGTSNLLNAAIECNTRYFIYVSTVDVVIGDDPIYFGAENTTPIPKTFVMGSYAKTKREAELLVIDYNKKTLANGTGTLRTLILRPSLLYGEGDPHFVTQTLRLTKKMGGKLLRIDNIFTRCQVSYVGNAAWACIKAKERIQVDESIGGEEFYITDDTPILDPYDFLKPYLAMHGMKVSSWSLPFWLVLLVLSLIHFFVNLLKPIYHLRLPPTFDIKKIKYICNTYFFNRNKAILRLDYDPLFTPEESQTRATEFYKTCKI